MDTFELVVRRAITMYKHISSNQHKNVQAMAAIMCISDINEILSIISHFKNSQHELNTVSEACDHILNFAKMTYSNSDYELNITKSGKLCSSVADYKL